MIPGIKAGIRLAVALCVLIGTGSCEAGGSAGVGGAPEVDPPSGGAEIGEALGLAMASIDRRAASIDSVFQPLPLLSPGQEDELRGFGNAEQLVRARALGIGGDRSEGRLARLMDQGALVSLADGDRWIVRELDYSRALVIPRVRDLLTEIGDRFHARLAAVGAPPYRMEITSVLRSAEDQARLRAVNPNAALGESTHEYGTTVDVAYNAFAAPAAPIVEPDPAMPAAVEPYLRRYADLALERVAARRSLELKAILGEVLIEMQREGRVMVTLERQQPVFHMTVAE